MHILSLQVSSNLSGFIRVKKRAGQKSKDSVIPMKMGISIDFLERLPPLSFYRSHSRKTCLSANRAGIYFS
jgi:hypothetical protein